MDGSSPSRSNTSERTVENLKKYIKEWVMIDNEIIQLKNVVKQKTQRKKELTDELVRIMKINQIDCFDINGGALRHIQRNVKKPITSKTLMSSLQSFFKTDPQMAEELTKYIWENREVQVVDILDRKIDK